MLETGAMARSFGREGVRRFRPPRVSQLWVKWLGSTRHQWANVFKVRKLRPDGRKGPITNSTDTCSTWRGMGSVRLYFAFETPWEKPATIPFRIGRRPCQQGPRLPPYTRTEVSLVHHQIFVEKNITIGTWRTRTLRAAGKLQELTRNGQVQMEHPWTL